jgi:aminomethyltransferase
MTRWPVRARKKDVGYVTSAIHSPRLERNIGYAMVPIAHAEEGSEFTVVTPWGERRASVVPKPFVDPGKEIPKA